MSHTSKHLGFKYVSGHLMGSGQQEKVSSQGIDYLLFILFL